MITDEVLKKVHMLPPLPVSVSRLTELASNQNSDISKMSEIISKDQAITSLLLKVVNSSFYGLSSRVTTISQAVMILGYNEIKNMVLSLSIMKIGKKMGSNTFFTMEDFWRHSLACAVLSKMLAKHFRFRESEENFVIGLIHDMGKLFLCDMYSKDYSGVLQNAEKREKRLYTLERELFGLDHAQIAELLCYYWKLPESIRSVVGNHHRVLDEKNQHAESLWIMKWANNLSKMTQLGKSGDPQLEELSSEFLQLKMTSEDIRQFLILAQEEVKRTEILMKLEV